MGKTCRWVSFKQEVKHCATENIFETPAVERNGTTGFVHQCSQLFVPIQLLFATSNVKKQVNTTGYMYTATKSY